MSVKNTFNKVEKDPTMSLLHETGHAYDHSNGNLFVKGQNIYRGLDVNEWQATHWENRMRSELGKSIRTYYGINIYNDNTTGAGPKLVRNKGGKMISDYLWRTQRVEYAY